MNIKTAAAVAAALTLGVTLGAGAVTYAATPADPCEAIMATAATNGTYADCTPIAADLPVDLYMADTWNEGDTYYTPCVWEDSDGPCYWDAAVAGNGQGTSFIRHESGDVTYLPTA